MKPRSLTTILFFVCVLVSGQATGLVPALAAAAEIAILKSSNIKAYNDAIDGFKAAVPNGSTFREYDLDGDLDRGRKLARRIRASDATLVLAVGLKAAMAAKLEIVDTPVIYVMVLDPSKHNLAAPNMTGIFLEVPLDRQLDTIRSLLPGQRRVGVLYDPSKTSAVVEEARRQAKAYGLELVAAQVASERDVPASLRTLLPTVGALWLVPDSTVLTDESLRYILNTALDQKVPVIGFSPEFVRSGALLSLSVNYGDIGRQAGSLARRILDGQVSLPLKAVPADRVRMTLNLKTARFLGIDVPKEIEARADEIY
ncbi:MAG TPA: ABC transporter substrate-binding protein [Nitrospiraceae bacterium]|nr:ABC transporter substrate-binding protein [Nitrospiraceae bacterium]